MKVLFLFFVYFISGLLADDSSVTCNETQKCPESMPCCSQYGICGIGSYCLGSCDPRYSYNLSACLPSPICKNTQTLFSSVDQLTKIDKFYGDATKADWVYDGTVLEYDNSVILAMPKNSGGTVISSARYLWYGSVEVKLKTSHLAGVVTAFIFFSDVQDEIDYENVGVDLYKFQTNYYYKGILDYHHSANVSFNDNSFENYHTLKIDWTQEYVQWLVNGQVGRTLYKNSTWNETLQTYAFPQTPARVQISLWPAGSSSAAGTRDWAGGAIDWNAPDIANPGYYYAFIQEATITCYDPPSGVTINGNNSYVYKGVNGNETDVEISDAGTFLKSFSNTGFDPLNSSTGNNTNSNNTLPSGISSGNNGGPIGVSGSDSTSTSITYTKAGFQQYATSVLTKTAQGIAVKATSISIMSLFTCLGACFTSLIITKLIS